MEIEKKIVIKWWCANTGGLVDVDHRSHLEEHADSTINRMMTNGYSSGELVFSIDSTHYLGHWELNTKAIN